MRGTLGTDRDPSKGKVLLLTTTMGIGGGAEEQVMQLALELDRRGWRTRLVSMIPAERMPGEISERGIPVGHLGMTAGVPDPRALPRLVQVVREFRPDILHTHMTHANLLGRVARIFARVPALISTLHGFRMYGVNQRFTKFRELGHRLTDPLAERTTAICEAATRSYLESHSAPADKLMSLPNGLDTSVYRPDSEARRRMRQELGLDGFAWLAVGRFEKPKNYPLMLRAFAELGQRDATLVLCGAGSLEPLLRRQIKELGIEGRVRLLGVREDIPAVMNAADAFVLSSDTEGLPMVILQASATGLPIVATDVGGNREAIQPGETGLLTPPGDQRAFTAAMRQVATLTTAERAAWGAAARRHTISKYDLQVVADRWEALYSELLTQH
ncbi:glycosyltransferase [Paludibaculum fermentans]|uniref:Glycosyltransferase n=1 Tax=Paludibaculum fermentans TaxID=1473598 RepID=A0A7S7SJZ1_PALFE|nr:glycosyltransferase [Paludibaculum fermentans]QOY86455.1 glycosyltransferase [Paludibaculum fermentans]